MDPEVIAQLEEQLRTMNELLAQQNSMMAAQMGAMKNAGGKLNAAAGGFAKGMGANEQANTKYAEAQAKAVDSSEKWDNRLKQSQMALTAFSLAVGSTTNVLGSLGNALLSAEKGFGKYGGTVDAAASAAQGLASAIPVVGQALGALVGVAGQIASKVVGDALKLTDAIVNLRDETVKTAGALPVSSEGLLKLANDAKYFGENIQTLGKITQGLGTGLVGLGATAGRGAVKFMEMANVTEQTRKEFGRLGVSQEQLTEMQGKYVKYQEASGLSYQLQTKTAAQLRKESLAYAENMVRLSGLTGKSADDLQAEQDLVASTIQARMEVIKENAEIKRLKKEGSDESLARAAELEKQQKDRADFQRELTALTSKEEAAALMKVVRSGNYDSVSGPLANLGVDIAKYGEMIKAGTIDSGKAARMLADELDAGRERIGTNLGATTEYLNDDDYKNLGIYADSIGNQLKRAGAGIEERNAIEEQDIKNRKEKGSPMDDAIEKARSAERQLQQKYQEFLIDGIKKAAALINQTDLMDTAMKVATGGLIALGAGIAAMAAASIAGWAIEQKIKRDAKAAQQDFTKALRESAAAMKQQTSASRDVTRANTAEARASGSAASADRSESAASNRARAADIAEARASGSAASADRTEAAASRRAASADMREAAASQRAATADMREAAASMKAAAADLREAKASDAAARADMRESMSGGGGFGGGGRGRGFGRGLGGFGRGLMGLAGRGSAGLVAGGGVKMGGDALRDYLQESGMIGDTGAAWMNVLSDTAAGAVGVGLTARNPYAAVAGGIAGLGVGLYSNWDKLWGGGADKAKPAAAGGIEEANKAAIASQLDILGSISSPGGVENMTPEQLAALGITPEVAPVVAQEPGTSEKEKAEQAESAKQSGYTIQKGDTLSQLAEKYGTTVEALMEANKQITNKDLIYEGAQLNIPGQEKLDEYTVKKGDTLDKIAKEMGMTTKALLQANPDLKNKDWKEGYKLNIPETPTQYDVKKGDTLANIAKEMGISLEQLQSANADLTNKDWKEGYKLNIPKIGDASMLGEATQFMGQDQLAGLGIDLEKMRAQTGMGGMPGAPGTGIAALGGMGIDGMSMNEQVLEEQLENNKKLFREPMQQAAEDKKTQEQVFTSLSSSMSLFKKNLDGTSKAFIDLMRASDELYKAMTGRDRPGSENAAPPSGPPGSGTGGNIPENVQGNLEKIAASLRKSGYTDENYINAVLGNVMKESGGNFNKEEDIAGYANTDNARIRGIFKTKTRGVSDAELSALKADPQAFANKMYGDRGGNSKPGDGWLFRGRGPIQLTGRGNYSKASRDIYGDDRLVQNPDLVMDPEVGAQVVAWFMKQNEDQMRGKLGFSKEQALSQADAALLATSQMAGQKITRGKGHLGGENLQKAESYASQMPSGMGTGKSSDGLADAFSRNRGEPNAGGAPGQNKDIISLGNRLRDQGLVISGHSAFGGTPAKGVHAENSRHYRDLAIDINAPGGITEANNPKWAKEFNDLASRIQGAGFAVKWNDDAAHRNHIHASVGPPEGSIVKAEKGGIFKGPDSGYPAILHGKEAVVPLDNKFTRTQAPKQANDMFSKMAAIQDKLSFDNISKMPGATVSSEYTVNGKPVDKKAYDSFMKANPELQNIQQKVQSMLGTISNDKLDPAKMISSMSRLMDNNLTGVKDEMIDKNKKIQDSLIQLVSRETNKALQAINETNQPMQNAATSITNSMQTVMKAHTSTMNELNYRLGQMVDAMETSNDVTKKILKKASA